MLTCINNWHMSLLERRTGRRLKDKALRSGKQRMPIIWASGLDLKASNSSQQASGSMPATCANLAVFGYSEAIFMATDSAGLTVQSLSQLRSDRKLIGSELVFPKAKKRVSPNLTTSGRIHGFHFSPGLGIFPC